MKQLLIFCLAALVFSSCASKKKMAEPERNIRREIQPVRGGGEMYSKHTLIIMYSAEVGKEPLLKAVKKYKATLVYDYRMMNGIAIRIPDGKTLEEAISYFSRVKGVLSVNKDRIMQLH